MMFRSPAARRARLVRCRWADGPGTHASSTRTHAREGLQTFPLFPEEAALAGTGQARLTPLCVLSAARKREEEERPAGRLCAGPQLLPRERSLQTAGPGTPRAASPLPRRSSAIATRTGGFQSPRQSLFGAL
ncbi:hypothetical protein CB1_000746010 [Camelus ferus]|nr:hypothetical protein CB1_000746010 [Camelus ferus]